MDDKQRISLVRIGAAQSGDSIPAIQFQLGDHLGSSNVVVDFSGAPINREEFTPYGETSFGSYSKKRYRFTGKERDEESGAHLHGARYLLSWLARWSSADPLCSRFPQSNPYTYAVQNPLRFVDPSGYVPDVPDPPKPAPPPQWEGGSPADEELILKIENWYAKTTGFAKSNGTFAELQKRAMNALDKFTTRQLNLINEGLSGQKFTEALRPEAAEMARAKDLLVECISLAREGESLKDELNTSGLSEGTTTGFRETPFKNILREKLIQGRRTLLRGSINKASGGGGGGTGGGGGGGTEEGGGEGGGSPKTGGNDPAPRGPSIFRRMITLESAATVVETGGYVIFLSQLATTRSSTQAINTTTNFIAASVGATVGGGIFGGVAGYVAPGFVPQAQALGMAAGGYVGSKTTEIVKETDWTDTLKQWAFVGGMGLLCFL